MYTTVGTCGKCGGAVMVPTIWYGIIPPDATCQKCGAIAANHGNILPMIDAPKKYTNTTFTINPVIQTTSGGDV